MATGTFLDGLNEWNAKSAVVIKDLALRGDFETASLLSSLRTTANDESLSQEVRLNALTALINRGELLDIPVPPYYPVAFSFTPTQTYVGLHNDLSGLNSGDYWHLTYAQYLSVLNKASISDITFANLTGAVDDNSPLFDAFNLKQDVIPAGSTGQFFGWDGGMRFVSWTNLTNKPTTLAGLGISAADTLFDGRYLSQSSILTSYTLGSNAAVLNTDSLVGAIGKLQAQVNSVASSTGTINSVGLTIAPTIFSVANSPLTGAGGTINVTLQSQAAKTFLAAPNAGSGTPSFRQIVVADLPTSGVSAGTYGNTTNWPTFTVDSYGRITSISTQAATSGGTVTSVGLSAPVEFVVSGSPVIDDGVLGLSWDSATANYVFAGPPTNVEEVPSFRALVPLDIPALAISKITGLQAALDAKMSDALNTSLIYMGNTSAKAVQSVVAGDLTALWSLVGSTNTATFTIADGAVTYAKFANVPDSALNTARPILLGRFDADQGPMQQMTLTNDFTLSEDGIIGLASPNPPALTDIGDLLTSTGDNNLVRLPVGASGSLLMPYNNGIDPNPGLIWGNVGGDISYTVNTDATPYGEFLIGAGKVTLDKMADADAFSFIGNNTASADTPVYLTSTQATALINSFDAGASLPGLVPNGPNDATYYLDSTGNWSVPSGGGGGGSGTVTSVSVVTANGFAGTVATPTVAAAITLTTSVTGLLKGDGTAISAATIGTGLSFSAGTLSNTGVTSVGLTMPSAFSVSIPTITTSGTFTVTGAGTASQYVRGDGTLALLPTAGGGGTAVSYYLNGSVPSSVVGYEQMNRVPAIGLGADFTIDNTAALMAQFMTDANDPSLLNIPAGAWDINLYFSAQNTTGNPFFYIELLKYDGTNYTSIGTSVNEIIGTSTIDLYVSSISVPSTVLTLIDRLVIRVYGNTDGNRTITLHTEGPHLAQVITTFSSGLTSLNGLNAQTQFFANGSSGLAPNWDSSTATHTLNIPLASASSVTAGLISNADYLAFSAASGGDVVGPVGSVIDGNFAVFGATGQIIKESTGASLTGGAAVFNSSVTVGVSGAAPTGQLIFCNSSNAGRTIIQGSTSQSAVDINYYWPQAPAASAGLVLSTDGPSGNLIWTATGTGNVTTAGTQIFTGLNTFNAGTIRIGNATNTIYTVLATNVTAANKIITFPDLAGVVALTNATQTISGQNNFTTSVQNFNTTLSVNKWSGGGAGVFRIESASENTYTTLETQAGTSNKTVTFPNSSGTVALTNSASTQIFTTAQTFQNTVFINRFAQSGNLRIENSGENTYTQIETLATVSNKIVQFPNIAGIVALLEGTQTFVGSKTFQAQVNVGNATYASATLAMGGTTRNLLSFPAVGNNVPTNQIGGNAGTRIIIAPSGNVSNTDYAIGYSSTNAEMWLSSAAANTKISFYGGTTPSPIRLGFFQANIAEGNGLFLGQTTTPGYLSMNSTSSNLIYFNDGGAAIPSITTTRSLGSKIVIKNGLANGSTDYAIGYNTNNFWFSAPSAAPNVFSWYGNNIQLATLSSTSGILSFLTVGSGIAIKDATASASANCRMGLATLVAGTVTVSNASITTNTRVFLTGNSNSGTEYGMVKVSARTNGVSFTITSYRGNNTTTVASGDTSTVAYLLIEPIA